ncbi:hypothetical protein RchiOBHm_Chr3g0471491 [Rosa chinensis]|uniref:Uncharacterized protein n=1 Tax=Rosa chinensis TaxID=74649 RepID=A0A2P6RBC5_ROSCH|nr:hypothetical protein RchiOBHm_Chr3g0471491 [Rosa chinensis]
MLILNNGGPSEQRQGPGKEDGFLISGWADCAVPLRSGETEGAVQLRVASFLRWDLAFPTWRSGLWQRRLKLSSGDPRWDMFQSWVWIWLRLSIRCRVCLQLGQAEWLRRDAARLRSHDNGDSQRREWLSTALALCWEKRWLGQAFVFGPCWCCVVSSVSRFSYFFSVVVLLV